MPDQIDLSQMQSVPVIGPYGFLRLHRYWKEPCGDTWDDIWAGTGNVQKAYWDRALNGQLSYDFENFFTIGQRLLDAGCGLGQTVLAFQAKGFDCHGLDYANRVIDLLNKQFPELPFLKGDIREIPYPDSYFDGYISLGIIEHFPEGQRKMLAEAARVLRRGGYACVSVPALNEFRKLRIKRDTYSSMADLPFFESCISEEELTHLMNYVGLKPVRITYMNPMMTFAQETIIRPLYRHIEDIRYVRGAIDRTVSLFLPNRWFGHMMMIVAQKT